MKKIYLDLMKQEWTLNDIDEMDFFWFLDLLAYKAEEENKTVYINEIF